MTIEWEDYRSHGGVIDLKEAFDDALAIPARNRNKTAQAEAFAFLDRVQELRPIVSRQVAALAIAQAEIVYANGLARLEREQFYAGAIQQLQRDREDGK
jgi:hypothetical protein